MADDADYCEGLVREADKDRFLATLFAPARHPADAVCALRLRSRNGGRWRSACAIRAAGEIRLQWWRDVLAGDSRNRQPAIRSPTRCSRRMARNGIDTVARAVADRCAGGRRSIRTGHQSRSRIRAVCLARPQARSISWPRRCLAVTPSEATKLACSSRRRRDARAAGERMAHAHRAVKALIASLPRRACCRPCCRSRFAVDDRSTLRAMAQAMDPVAGVEESGGVAVAYRRYGGRSQKRFRVDC